MLYDINKNQAKPYPHHRKPYPKNLLTNPERKTQYTKNRSSEIPVRKTIPGNPKPEKTIRQKPYPEIRSPKKPSDFGDGFFRDRPEA